MPPSRMYATLGCFETFFILFIFFFSDFAREMTEMPLPHLRPPPLTTSSSSSPYSSSEEKSSASWSATGFLRRLRVEEGGAKGSRQARRATWY